MAVFELEANGKSYEVEAPDMASAVKALGLPDAQGPSVPAPPTAEPNAPEKWDRAMLLPLAVNQKNEGALAVPGLIYEPYAAAMRLMSPEGKANLAIDPSNSIPDALTAASAALPGTLPRGGLTRGAFQAAKKADDAATAAFGPKVNPTELDARIQKFGAAEPKPNAEMLDAAKRQGVEVPSYMASESLIGKRVAGGLRDIPVIGDPVAKATTKMADQIGERVGVLSNDLAPSATAQGAGTAARDSLVDWMKTGSRIEIEHGYDMLDKVIKPDTKMVLSNTQKRAAEMTIKDIESATPDGQRVIDFVREALQRPTGLTYTGLKELRTRIGDRLNGDIVEPGTSQKLLKGLYEALTKDLEQSVYQAGKGKRGSSGKRALATWQQANEAAKQIYDQKEKIGEILGTAGDARPQQVFERIIDLAGSGRSADLSRLQIARNTVGPDAWAEIGAAAISRMGLDKNGKFSPARFTSDYSAKKLSDEGKIALFGQKTKAHLDDLARLSQEWETNQRYGNPSGTARGASVVGAIVSAWANPLMLAAEIGTGVALARVLARPAGAEAVSRWAKMYAQRAANPSPAMDIAVRQAARVLAVELGHDSDEDARTIEDQLSTSGRLYSSRAGRPEADRLDQRGSR